MHPRKWAMPDLTPIRIRGKRTATEAEKWHSGRQRKVRQLVSLPPSEYSSGGRSTPSLARATAKRSRKRADTSLSRLEQLPTEILQSVFEYSSNVDLPLASPRLASQLGSGVLYHQLTTHVLGEVLGSQAAHQSNSDISHAMRLMNCKFFTWPFFKAWLHGEFDRRKLQVEWEEAVGQKDDLKETLRRRDEWTWYRLGPSPALPPPSKLLRRPFTDDNVHLLKFLIGFFRGDCDALSPVYLEQVQEGLGQAVEDGAGDALNAFFCLGAHVDTELLRKAVIDAGCDKDVIQRLIACTTHLTSEPVGVDFLDPALWAWADKVKASGDDRGLWLVERLQSAARDSGQGSGDAEAK